MTKIINGDWIMEKDEVINEDLIVKGNISGKNGIRYNLQVNGDLNCWDLNCGNLNCWDLNCWDLKCRDLKCWDLKCRDLNCGNLNCWDLKCRDLNCWDLKCRDLKCWDLSFYAIVIAYSSFKCKTWKARRSNYIIKCLDGKIIGKKLKEVKK